MRCLIVDERSHTGRRIAEMVQQAVSGCECTRVGDAWAYRQALAAAPVDLVLTQHALPWTDGLAVLRDVQAHWPGVPVIMISGARSERLAMEGFRAGLQDYVTHDALDELVPAVRAALGPPKDGQRPAAYRAPTHQIQDAVHLAAVAAKLGAYVRDFQTGEDYWSPEFLAIFGLEPGDPLALKDAIPAAVHPEDRAGVAMELRARLTRTANPEFNTEHRIIRRDGEVRWVLVRGRVDFDAEGRPLGSYGFVMDITDRKQAEQELQRRNAEFESLYNQMTEGVVLFDPDGNLLGMNQAALAIHGFENAEHLKRHLNTLTDTFELFDLAGNPLPTEEWPIGRVLRGETFERHEVRVRRPDTGRTWIGSYGGTPVYGPDGELMLAIVTLRDVTAHRSLVARVQRQAAELEATFQALPAGLILHGPDGEVLRMNAAAEQMQAYTPDDRERPLSERVATLALESKDGTPVADVTQLPVARALRGETVLGQVYSWIPYSERVRHWYMLSAAPIRSPDG